jgi:hypothetical protein
MHRRMHRIDLAMFIRLRPVRRGPGESYTMDVEILQPGSGLLSALPY